MCQPSPNGFRGAVADDETGGENGGEPKLLVDALQRHGVIKETPPEAKAELTELIAEVFSPAN